MADTTLQTLPPDSLADLAPSDVQIQAARLVHEAFAAALRLTANGEGKQLEDALARLASHLREWSRMTTPEAAHLRLAMILAGLDQWGLAYSQAFGAPALAGLSLILADLRDNMDLAEEGMCQRFLDTLHGDEASALEFKIAFRRELHLSLWHTMIAAENREQAEVLLHLLGGMLLALNRAMPTLGWRLVADTLATIQIRCLQHGLAASGLEQEMTEELFAGLTRELPDASRDQVNQLSAEAVRAWQEARHATQH
ncbi:hypothetical protein GCM10027046_16530 [Uliginosibacterium flavum]|uniref:Uncharacterized protein n=1 Tax=Uliginosibacterium flavum TaxID=1396831 RepID=A0ABV2TP44_9RHOO